MHSFGRFLQFVGLVLVPMALIYYFQNENRASERELMTGELTILGVGAGVFVLGHWLQRKGGA